MLKIMKDLWAKNSALLKKQIEAMSSQEIDDLSYIDLVKMAMGTIFNNKDKVMFYNDADVANIHEIDDGDYQGTLLYLIPFDAYQPCEYEYLMTYVGYGSCSGCDTLQGIQHCDSDIGSKHRDLFELCEDIISNTIKPYNGGWREHDLFTQAEVEHADF